MVDIAKVYTYFGWVEADNKTGIGGSNGTKVRIVDNLSSKLTEFTLPTDRDGIVQLGTTELHVLILGNADNGPLWLFSLQTETLSKLHLSTSFNSPSSPPIFMPADEIILNIRPMQDTTINRITQQFSHWNEYQRQGWTAKIAQAQQSSPSTKLADAPRKHMLACTAFGAFLVTNNFQTNASFLQCLYRRENPSFSHNIDEPCGNRASTSSADPPTSQAPSQRVELPFQVKKFQAGQDHLALLSPSGYVYMFGTGTKGELGNGHMDKGQWEEPKLVEALAEAGIRVVDLACGAWHTVAMTDEGDLYGWGWNSQGQLGHRHEFSIQPTPHPFELPDEEDVQIVHCAGNSTFVLMSSGRQCIFGEMDQQETMATTSANHQETSSAEPETSPAAAESTSKSAEPFEEPKSPPAKRARQAFLRLAIAGCSHGQMDTIYERLTEMEGQRNIKFDLLICCGDFQAIRNHGDLHYYHAPPHHRKLGTFYKYYSGEKVAPILTLFVGGNHESSGYMAELPNGGWVAPNIYYMGYASVVQFAGLRIAGLSGIYKQNDYNRGHYERPPFHERGSIVSAYHVRSLEIFRMRQLQGTNLDVCISHDWPAGITDFGDKDWLLRIKPHFTEDVQLNRLGNPATMNLLYELKPAHWFAAHMHVRFTAVVPHSPEGQRGPEGPVTRFLALDKPMKDSRRRFLEFMDIPVDQDAPKELHYDPHWLAILKATDEVVGLTDQHVRMPDETASTGRTDFRPTPQELDDVHAAFNGNFRIPLNFQRTAPPENEPWGGRGRPASLYYRNPQSQQFCEKLNIRDLNLIFAQASVAHLGIPHCIQEADAALAAKTTVQTTDTAVAVKNPEEIDLGDEDEFGDEDFVLDVKGKQQT